MPFFMPMQLEDANNLDGTFVEKLAEALFPLQAGSRGEFSKAFKNAATSTVEARISAVLADCLGTTSILAGLSQFCERFGLDAGGLESLDYPGRIRRVASHKEEIDKKLRQEGF